MRVEIGYFVHGGGIIGAASGGTAASALGVLFTPSHRFTGGRLVLERAAKHVRTFRVDGAARQGVSLGGSEHLALPRFAPQLREIGCYLGWPGGQARLAQAGLGCWAAMRHLPGSERVVTAGFRRFGPSGSTGGPDEAARARTSAVVVAQAFDAAGALLSDVVLRCGNPYDFTAEILAWAAGRAAEGGVSGAGALGPVSAFGLPALVAGCAQAGLVEDARPDRPGGSVRAFARQGLGGDVGNHMAGVPGQLGPGVGLGLRDGQRPGGVAAHQVAVRGVDEQGREPSDARVVAYEHERANLVRGPACSRSNSSSSSPP